MCRFVWPPQALTRVQVLNKGEAAAQGAETHPVPQRRPRLHLLSDRSPLCAMCTEATEYRPDRGPFSELSLLSGMFHPGIRIAPSHPDTCWQATLRELPPATRPAGGPLSPAVKPRPALRSPSSGPFLHRPPGCGAGSGGRGLGRLGANVGHALHKFTDLEPGQAQGKTPSFSWVCEEPGNREGKEFRSRFCPLRGAGRGAGRARSAGCPRACEAESSLWKPARGV